MSVPRRSGQRTGLSRKLKVLDLMILVAAVGVAIPLYRSFDQNPFAPLFPVIVGYQEQIGVNIEPPVSIDLTLKVVGLSTILAVLSVAMLILWLLPPRPSLSRLGRRPGMVSCLVTSVVAFAVAIPYVYLYFFQDGGEIRGQTWSAIYGWATTTAHVAGYSVAGAWLVLAMIGRWRPGPSWLDYSGILVGCLWLTLIVFISIVGV